MSDYISREEAIEAVVGATIYKTREEIRERCERSIMDDNDWIGGIDDAIDALDEVPAADVVERKTSEWLHDLLQDAIDAGIITEVQAVAIMDHKGDK